MEWARYQAVLFDLDGVLTPTAEVHMRAWSEMFNDFLRSRQIDRPYTDEEYFAFVDGKPRYDGVRSFLASRRITLSEGLPSDDPTSDTVCGLGNRKNELFNIVLARDGVDPYPGSLRLLDALRATDTRLGVVSSSRNAPAVLDAAGIAERFEVVVDGALAAERGLPGKPAPDTFTYAAGLLGASAPTSVVVEDAVSGIAAGRAGGFALVIGVDRGAGREALTAAGAELICDDLAELLPRQPSH